MPKAVSKKQARLLGVIASGKTPEKDIDMSEEEAKKRLRGVDVSKLPDTTSKSFIKTFLEEINKI